ncbi:MAG: YicC family protein [Rhodobacteraceae bacterium]|nr:YicC family protein [Paracoccaceae bacterium]
MVNSMTGFASGRGEGAEARWTWDLRGVNARGLDLRLRLPDGIDGLEPALRAAIGRRVQRGSLTLALRLDRNGAGEGPRLARAGLAAALAALAGVEQAAIDAGLGLAPVSAADVLALPGVLVREDAEADAAALRAALLADAERLLDAFAAARAAEGASLATILAGQVDRIAALAGAARAAAADRAEEQARALRAAVARVLETAEGLDPARLAQELALIATRSDVTEELDRLAAHVAAARAMLAETGPVGRRLDFLTQEFNREANTLCAKAGSAALTRIGLDLKAVIDQLREQVQNVE